MLVVYIIVNVVADVGLFFYVTPKTENVSINVLMIVWHMKLLELTEVGLLHM